MMAYPTVMVFPIQPFMRTHAGIQSPINPRMMVVDVAHSAYQRMKRLIRLLHVALPTGLGAFALPSEIILMIILHLDQPSITSLALSCRKLYSLCFPDHPLRDMTERKALLLLLEKDVASHYFCHQCVKLHRWHKRWSKSVITWSEGHTPCKKHRDNDLLLDTVNIPYYQARLAMNRHFYGPAHGPPLSKLVAPAWSDCDDDGVLTSQAQHARIVDNRLLLLSVMTMSHSRGDSGLLKTHIDALGLSVCPHLTLNEGCPGSVPKQIPQLARVATSRSLFTPCQLALGSCTFCLTDYSINISWEGAKKGHVVKVLVHRQLGDCRSPTDWSWRTISTEHAGEEPRTAFPFEYRLGCVRDRWNKADGVTSETRGAWVENPGYASLKSLLVTKPASTFL